MDPPAVPTLNLGGVEGGRGTPRAGGTPRAASQPQSTRRLSASKVAGRSTPRAGSLAQDAPVTARRESKFIQVYLRVRPLNQKEKQSGERSSINISEDRTAVCLGSSDRDYQFHHVFDENSTQEQVFERVARNAVRDALAGYHGLVFAYGQTGTGKTYTVSGAAEARSGSGGGGILQKSLSLLFERIEADTAADYKVSVQFIQIYQEVVEDLLVSRGGGQHRKGLLIRDDAGVEGSVYVTPVHTEEVYRSGAVSAKQGVEAANRAFLRGDSNRTTGQTLMNVNSSRSHSVFTVFLERRSTDGEGRNLNGRLILVDLAGSERQKKSGAGGDRLVEATSINGSLLVLGKVIKALTDPRQFVPFRESKLTRLLQYSLAGHGQTSVIITVGPAGRNLDETKSSVEFGQRAMKVKQHAKQHVEIDYKVEYYKLKAQLEAEVGEACSLAVSELEQEHAERMKEKDAAIRQLEAQLAALAPFASPGSPSPAETPAASDARARKYRQQLHEVEARCESMREEVHARNDQLLEAAREHGSLKRELRSLKEECSQLVESTYMAATEGRKQFFQKDDEIDRLMYAIGRMRHRMKSDQVSAKDEGPAGADFLNATATFSDAPGLSDSMVSEPAADMIEGASTSGQLLRLLTVISKLRRERNARAERRREMELYFGKACLAIKLLAEQQSELLSSCESLRSRIEATDARSQDLREALVVIRASDDTVTSSELRRIHSLRSSHGSFKSRSSVARDDEEAAGET